MDGFNLGDVISLIIVFALYLIAASGRTKKGKRGAGKRPQRSPMRTRAQGEQADRRAAERDRQTRAGFDNAFEQTMQTAQKACDEQPMHLHAVSQRQFADAAEGEDPCHVGGAARHEHSSYDSYDEASSETLAQDVLRGVIMSEILTRPHERAVLRRGRR